MCMQVALLVGEVVSSNAINEEAGLVFQHILHEALTVVFLLFPALDLTLGVSIMGALWQLGSYKILGLPSPLGQLITRA